MTQNTENGAVRWVEVSCEVADAIRVSEPIKPTSFKTDLSGVYGEPEVYTEWSAIYQSGRLPLMSVRTVT